MMNRNSSAILIDIKEKDSDYWERVSKHRALKLFHLAAKRVPAYKDFLKTHKINSSAIKTFEDFQNVPITNKNNYLRKYPLAKLLWNGSLKKSFVFTSTSGSTGTPFYFPRTSELDWQYSILINLYLEQTSYKTNGPVLVIIGFGMGVWIGGLITYKAFEMVKNHKGGLSIITPGINKPEIFHALKNLSPQFKETILVGYPPFIKDILDEASEEGVNLKKINLRVLNAAESYTEKFRDYLVAKSNLANIYLDTLNIYGTADLGAMAFETPVSIKIRRLATKNKKLFKDLFMGANKTPTLAQYNPLFATFESPDNEILITGDNAIPLIRYFIGDRGGTMSFSSALSMISKRGIDFSKEVKRDGIEKFIYKLPFVYVYERNDFSTKLYGATVYPEPIRDALCHKQIMKWVTGKFSMTTKFDRKHNQFLEINVELKPETTSTKKLKSLVTTIILRSLIKNNAEFRNNYSFIPKKVQPRIVFWQHEDPHYFKSGIKQKWVLSTA